MVLVHLEPQAVLAVTVVAVAVVLTTQAHQVLEEMVQFYCIINLKGYNEIYKGDN
jgi:hypothetical protein